MSITFIGDVHGKFDAYHALAKKHETTIQVGDMGLGFGQQLPKLEDKDYFIHGNHDNVTTCWTEHPDNFLGRYGYKTLEGKRIFFMSGAYSIDKAKRIEGVDWWRSEELRYTAIDYAIRQYMGADVIVTHDCPLDIYTNFNYHKVQSSLTASGLSMIWSKAKQMKMQPKLWVFGHHHVHFDKWIDGTRFICLPELKTFTI